MSIDPMLVEQIRRASRTMVRELGFMQPTLAGTAYSASAVHALMEIAGRETMTAAELVQVLGLEKSSVSRMLAKLLQAGEIAEGAAGRDARSKSLGLTAKGLRTVAQIHAFGQRQVTTALASLTLAQQQGVAQGLAAYAGALQALHSGDATRPASDVAIRFGYRPGLVGRVAEMHGAFYARHSGFGQFFESQVASGVAEFAGRLEQPRNGIWSAVHGERIVGSLAIDGEDLGDNQAHLRWFILDDACRGRGVGRRLLEQALAFCDERGFAAVQLWTFKGLDAARRLYESCGFELACEQPGSQWGREVIEQQFTRRPGLRPPV